MKPVLYCANIAEEDIKKDDIPYVNTVKEIAAKEGSGVVVISAKIEEELGELSPEDREMFLEDLGIESAGLDKMINASYTLLGLISFLTAGPKEVRGSPPCCSWPRDVPGKAARWTSAEQTWGWRRPPPILTAWERRS